MEQPSFSNVILNNASDPFLNGGQVASGSSSSATSTNGTPSHSYKGSQSSPSSDELSGSGDPHNQHRNQLPYSAPISMSKQITSNSALPMKTHHTTNNQIQTPFMNNSQSTTNIAQPSKFNQNLFQGNFDPKTQSFENPINTANAAIRGTNTIGRPIHSNLPPQPQPNPIAAPKQLSPQLPNLSQPLHPPNVSSYFNSNSPSNTTSFSAPAIVASKALTNTTNSYPRQPYDVSLQPRVNYAQAATTFGLTAQPIQSVAAEEKMAASTPPVASSFITGAAAAYPKYSQPGSVGNIAAPPAAQPYQQMARPQPPNVSMAPRPAAVSSAVAPASATPMGTSYQNVSLQNSTPAYPNPHQPYATRSQIQSHSQYQNTGFNQNANVGLVNPNQKVQTVPPGFSGMSHQPGLAQPFPQLINSQQQINSRPHEMNGYPNASVYGQYPQHPQPYPNVPPSLAGRYPAQHQDMKQMDSMSRQFGGISVTKQGYYGARGIETCDLLRMKDILPKEKVEPPNIILATDSIPDSNCHPDVFRCTLTRVPESKALLDKSRLPLGILLHPFRDLTHLSVIQCSTIVRCRSCRTYINPFVFFIDNRHWKCNLCFRANDLPEDFRYNPLTKMHDDPLRRPEVKNATIEFIASSEYMVRPPQPAIYLFILDVSRLATQSGYLSTVCEILSNNLTKLPGDTRTAVGFILVDSAVRFYDLGENLNQPHELIVSDVDDIFIPHPDNLLVNLQEQIELIKNLLELIPDKFKESFDTNCALGAALQAAYKLMAPTGGRVTVFVSSLPNYGPGELKPREDPNQRGNNKFINLNPATDFYKKLGLDCNGQHVAVDLFVVNSQFVDLATMSGVSQVSGGCIHHFPLYSNTNAKDVDKLVKTFERYLTRKVGFEAVMRMRCTKGLSIHSFHGNFFVRTTDLLALPNINPDAGFGMQISIDENLSDLQTVCLQAALLYTSSKGERRIRVHTLCLPVTNNVHDVLVSADQQCIAGLLSKMAVDRSLQASVADAREAFINAICDIFNAYKLVSSSGQIGTLLAPNNLCLFPLYILGLLKSVAFRLGTNTRTDDRVFSMYQMKCIPLDKLMQIIYPDLYAIHNLTGLPQQEIEGKIVVIPPIMQLSAERIDSTGVYLLDEGECLVIFICHNIPPHICQALLGYPHFNAIPDDLDHLPVVDTAESKLAQSFINYLQIKKLYSVPINIIKDTKQIRTKFFEKLVDDKTEFGMSYHEFLQTVNNQMNN